MAAGRTSLMPTNSTAQRVTAEVRAEMARQRKSQTAIAKALNMSQVAVSRRLRGEVDFTVTDLARLADVLGVPLAQFIPIEAA